MVEWERQDPIQRVAPARKNMGDQDYAEVMEIQEAVKKEIDTAVEFAEEMPLPEGPEKLEGVYAETLEEVHL